MQVCVGCDALQWAKTFWIFPLLLSLLIPAISVYLLIKQLVLFYFLPHGDQSESQFSPRFALSAIAFPNDDGYLENETPGSISRVKAAVIMQGYSTDNVHLVFPPNLNSRDRRELVRFERERNSARYISAARQQIRDRFREQAYDDACHYDIRASLSGFTDRTLVEEAARLEALSIRLNTLLRRIVLRYMKSLVAFIWTILVVIICLAGLKYVDTNTSTYRSIEMKEGHLE